MQLSGVRILVVEDLEDLRLLAELWLKAAGAVVALAGDGKDGVAQAKAFKPGVVLMDLNMPRLDGFAALMAMRTDGFTGPAIAVTASAFSAKQIEVAGFAAVLRKPVSRSGLVDCILAQMAREGAGRIPE